ncbi:MAG: DUF4390 domain-containing protein [gamma proteobacterium symbiont of Bathyaustriella thionipta]|nr:DUF4390 domain-containing protein [gamma proteobacterium symbiont of Bathyaustriella thionipta]
MMFLKPLFFIAMLTLTLAFSNASAADIDLSDSKVYVQDEEWFLDLIAHYEFSDDVLEALKNGVPITIDISLQLMPDDAWFWQAREVQRNIRLEIRYFTLSELYQVRNLGSGAEVSFVSRSAALETLGQVLGIFIIKQSKLAAGRHYTLSVKAKLDIDVLPVPLRPAAWLSSDWRMSSGWVEWSIDG